MKLKNVFSWSFSAAMDFESCQRKRYWNKYGKWGGWDRDAAPVVRRAYQLDKMDNFYSMLGQAVELAAMQMLRCHQSGRPCPPEAAYEEVAKIFMNNVWRDSRSEGWRKDPKRVRCLREHYYGSLTKEQERDLTSKVARQVKVCLTNFAERTLPRLAGVAEDMELPIQTADTPGDVENFAFEGVKIYAIPDYAYRKDGVIHIHDWKAGRPKCSHLEQLSVYGLWAECLHRKDAENIVAYVEYLKDGALQACSITAADLERIRNRIESSIADMTEMLIDADRERNEPLPMPEWELALSGETCRYCNFFELCRAELMESGILEK